MSRRHADGLNIVQSAPFHSGRVVVVAGLGALGSPSDEPHDAAGASNTNNEASLMPSMLTPGLSRKIYII